MIKDFMDYKNELNLANLPVEGYSILMVTATKTGRIRSRLMSYNFNNKMRWVKL